MNFTAVAPVKALPLIVTTVPTGPPVVVKLPIDGSTRNELALVAEPSGVVTVIGPVAAPVGTVTMIAADETTVNDALVPANATPEAPENPLPEIVTDVPTTPPPGEKELIMSGATTESWAVPLTVPSVPVTV